MKKIRVLTEEGKQYHLTIPGTIVHHLFKREFDGRYYVRIHVEDDELRVTPLTTHPQLQHPDPLEVFNRLQRLTEEEKC